MMFIFLFFLYLFKQAVSSQPPIYHNHAVWWVGNFTAAPTNPVPDPVNNGLATIANRCDHPVYVWEARDRYQDDSPTEIKARSKKSYTIKNQYDIPKHEPCLDNCGVTYKISKTRTLVGGQGGNQIQFEYSTRDGKLYYDISFVDCATITGYRQGDASSCPAWVQAVEIAGRSTGDCKKVYCLQTEMCIHDAQGAYYIDDPTEKWGLGAPIGTCPSYKAGTEIEFVLCSTSAPV